MHEWSESQIMIRDAVRRFLEAEVAPNVEQLEHGDLPPYDILRKLYSTFGMDEMARERFRKQIEAEKQGTAKQKIQKRSNEPTTRQSKSKANE